MGGVLATKLFHQLAGVDSYRAALRTKTGGGAGVDALVFVGRFEFAGVDPGAFLRLDVPPDHDPLARAQGQAFGGADRLAEAAFDALVDDLVGGRQRFQMLEVDLRVFAEHHVRIENAVGIEQALELPHQLVGVAAPFQFDEGCHVAPGTVLGLERTAELDSHQLRHVVHERLVACDFFRAVEALGEDEVQIAFQCVSEKDRFVVVMFVEQLDQPVHAEGQLFHREGHVLDDHRGSGFAHRADGGEGVLADRPEPGVFQRVFGEIDLLLYRERRQRRHDLRQLFLQQRGRCRAGFDQQGAGIVRQLLYESVHAGLVLHRAQATAVQQLYR